MGIKSRWQAFWGIFGCYALYLVFSWSSWREPIMGDEVIYALFVRGLVHHDILKFFQSVQPAFGLWHPPLYAHILSLFEKFSIFNAQTARLVGATSFLSSLILIYGIARELFKSAPKKNEIGLLACLLFSLNPLAVRGSLLIDMDGTVLNAAVLGFIYLLLIYENHHARFIGQVVCAAGLALCFWIKLATPIFLIGSFLAYFCLTRDFGRAGRMAKVVALGLALFSVTWFIYASARGIGYGSVWEVPLTVVRGFLGRTGVSKDGLSLTRNVWALLVWCSPVFIVLGLISLGRAFFGPATGPKEEGLLSLKPFAFYGFVVFGAYFLIGGVTHSFPKYHYAILPVFVVAISGFVVKNIDFNRRLIFEMALAAVSLAVFNIAGAGDPLYTINYALKSNIVLNAGIGAFGFFREELVQVSFVVVTVAIAYLFFRRLNKPKAWLLSLVVSMAACQIALNVVQMKAPYNTVYCYGAEGVAAAAGFVRAHTRVSEKIFAPPEILWLANENLSSYTAAENLRTKAAFLNMLENDRPACVVYGVSGNTVQQYKEIFNQPDVQLFFASAYRRTAIGSYQIWLKK